MFSSLCKALGIVHRLIPDLAVFDFIENGTVLIETMGGVTVDEVKQKTDASFTVAPILSEVS